MALTSGLILNLKLEREGEIANLIKTYLQTSDIAKCWVNRFLLSGAYVIWRKSMQY